MLIPVYLVVVLSDDEDRLIDYIEPFQDEEDARQYHADQQRFVGSILMHLVEEHGTPTYRPVEED